MGSKKKGWQQNQTKKLRKKKYESRRKKTETPANNIVLGIELGKKGFPTCFEVHKFWKMCTLCLKAKWG